MSTLFDPTPEPGTDAHADAPTDTRGDPHDEATLPTAGVAPDRTPRAHRPSVLHLVIGLVFLGLAALWALSASGAVGSDDTWLIPGLLVVAGATGLVAAVAGSHRRDR